MTTPPRAPRVHMSPTESMAKRAQARSEMRPEASRAPQTQGEAPTQDAAALSKRQLRRAMRLAQQRGLAPSSEQDAIEKLNKAGIDPLGRSHVLAPVGETQPATDKNSSHDADLPQVVQQPPTPAKPSKISALEERASEIRKMQLDIARRRQKNLFLVIARLIFFIGIPTLIAGIYFYRIATPMYSTKAEFVIQKAGSTGSSSLGGLFQGTSMAMQQDSTTVQSYLSSMAAMERLDQELDFRGAFTAEEIDPLQRLREDATLEEAYKVYKRHIRISYDPTEGQVRTEVITPHPDQSMAFIGALINYAEEQVDQMTSRVRADQMKGANENYESAEQARTEALRHLTQLKAEAETIDPAAESSSLMSRISRFEGERDQLRIRLQSLKSNPRPNAARVRGLEASISQLDEQITLLRSAITTSEDGSRSQTEINAIIREAEENYQARLMLVQEALAQRESAQMEANRQSRYLSLSVPPTKPDASSYPKGFENTALAFLIFSGIYLIISLTAAVIREQITA